MGLLDRNQDDQDGDLHRIIVAAVSTFFLLANQALSQCLE